MFFELIIDAYCLSNGIIPYKNYKKYEIYYFLILITYEALLSIGIIIAYFQAPNITYKVLLLGWLSMSVFAIFIKATVFFHREELLRLTSKLRKNTIFGITNILEKMKHKMKYKIQSFVVVISITAALEIFSSFSHFLTKPKIDYNDQDLYLIPYFVKFWPVNSFGGFLFVFFVHSILTVPEIIDYVSPLFFLWYVIVSVEVHLEELRNYANNLPIFHPENGALLDRTRDDSSIIINQTLRDLVKLQQYIHRYFTDFVNFSKWMINVLMSYFISNLIIFSFLTATHKEINGDIVSVMRSLASSLTLMHCFYVTCYTGEVIYSINESETLSFYNTPWCDMPPRSRKYISTAMIQSQYVKSMKVIDMHVINMNLFYKTMANVYAIVNALLIAQRKNMESVKNE